MRSIGWVLGLWLVGLGSFAQAHLLRSQERITWERPSAILVDNDGTITVIPDQGAPVRVTLDDSGKVLRKLVEISQGALWRLESMSAEGKHAVFRTNEAGRSAFVIVDPRTGTVLGTAPLASQDVAAFHEKGGFARYTHEGFEIRDLKSGRVTWSLGQSWVETRFKGNLQAIRWSPDGAKVILQWHLPDDGRDDPCDSEKPRSTVLQVLDVVNRRAMASLTFEDEVVDSAQFTPLGDNLVLNKGKKTSVTSLKRNKLDGELMAKPTYFVDFVLSPTNQLVFSLGFDRIVAHDLVSGELMGNLLAEYLRLAVSPDGKWIALADQRGFVALEKIESFIGRPIEPKSAKEAWEALGSSDPLKGLGATQVLDAHPEWVAKMEEQVDPHAQAVSEFLKPLFIELDDKDYSTRVLANRRLESAVAGPDKDSSARIVDQMQEALQHGALSPEVQVSIEYLLKSEAALKYQTVFATGDEQLRKMRLESIRGH